MKREDLKALELTETQIDSVLDSWHQAIRETNDKLAVMSREKEGLEIQVSELNERIKTFDGVDIEELKKAPQQLQAEYEAKIQNMMKESAVREALKDVKHPSLLMKEIDFEQLNVEEGKVKGLDEQLNTLRDTYADLFEVKQAVQGVKPVTSKAESHSITKEQILAIKDQVAQQKAIEENIELFNK